MHIIMPVIHRKYYLKYIYNNCHKILKVYLCIRRTFIHENDTSESQTLTGKVLKSHNSRYERAEGTKTLFVTEGATQ